MGRAELLMIHTGRHFLQIPGPTNVPDRILRAIGRPVIDLSTEVLPRYLGRIGTFHNRGYHRDIGSPESLRRAEVEFRPG